MGSHLVVAPGPVAAAAAEIVGHPNPILSSEVSQGPNEDQKYLQRGSETCGGVQPPLAHRSSHNGLQTLSAVTKGTLLPDAGQDLM